jgi:hypothetical protein
MRLVGNRFIYHYSPAHYRALSPRKKRATTLFKKTQSHSRFCAGSGANLEKNYAYLKAANQTPQKFSCIFHILFKIRGREFCGATERRVLRIIRRKKECGWWINRFIYHYSPVHYRALSPRKKRATTLCK